MANEFKLKLMEPSLAPWAPKGESSRQIALLMSGGVDSSVTAHLLKEAGWEVLGITMKIPVACNTGKQGCCGADAAFVCNELGIPHYFVDATEAFEELIIKPFRQSYAQGRTPNPCVDCNTLLKFSLLWDIITQTFGITFLATGHYGKITKTNSGTFLGRAKCSGKDQSYFLYGIDPDKLANLVLPLGDFSKEQVRSVAAGLGLTVADKEESMEICFAGQGNYRDTLAQEQRNQPGDMTDMAGNKIGTHSGIANYTLGQRRGLGFAGGEPLYVGKIDAKTNTIALGKREEVTSAFITAGQINVFIPEEMLQGRQLFGKIRSYGTPSQCRIIAASEGEITVEFDQPQFAPCRGQRLVLYNSDDNIACGGVIS